MKLEQQKGFTLIELVLIILILGVLASVAVRQLSSSITTAEYEHTKKELDQLALAIVGNPNVYVNGSRTDFGYVGDVGALPLNLDALITNPGAYASWDGPYITNGTSNNDLKKDAWNADYILSSTSIRSTGSGSNIDKIFTSTSSSLLANNLYGYILDASGQAPGSVYKDSLIVTMRYPNGSGGYNNSSTLPDNNGNFSFTSLPIGVHTLSVIYIPDSDTVSYTVAINPESENKIAISLPADLF